MAESLDDAEFWLPPQFLADEELFPAEPETKMKKKSKSSFGSASDLGSPVDSLVWSSETESESEEEFLAGIAFQMSRTTLENDNRKARNLSGSPQSTLCGGFGSGEQGSSRGSPNAATSRVSSPPPPRTLDLLNAAAGEVAKIRTVAEQEEEQRISHSHSQIHVGHLRNPSFDFQRQYQFGQLKQIQIMKQQAQLRYHQIQQQQKRFHDNNSGTGRTLGLPNSAWPTLQQAQNPRNGSNMTALFLGNQLAGKRECAGTGVFLPRQQLGGANKTEPRRKQQQQVCSTVLLPARVVQALNLNMDNNGNPQPRFHGGVASDADMTKLSLRNDNNVGSSQKRNVRPQQQQEIRLPQDWTY